MYYYTFSLLISSQEMTNSSKKIPYSLVHRDALIHAICIVTLHDTNWASLSCKIRESLDNCQHNNKNLLSLNKHPYVNISWLNRWNVRIWIIIVLIQVTNFHYSGNWKIILVIVTFSVLELTCLSAFAQ